MSYVVIEKDYQTGKERELYRTKLSAYDAAEFLIAHSTVEVRTSAKQIAAQLWAARTFSASGRRGMLMARRAV